MNFIKYLLIFSYLLHALGCAAPQTKEESKQVAGVLSQYTINGSDFKIYLYEHVVDDHLQYLIKNTKNSKSLSIISSRYKSDGFNLKVGTSKNSVF